MKDYSPIESISSKKELAKLYHVHRNTMSKWLKMHGLQFTKRKLLPKDVRKVIQTLGPPPGVASSF